MYRNWIMQPSPEHGLLPAAIKIKEKIAPIITKT